MALAKWLTKSKISMNIHLFCNEHLEIYIISDPYPRVEWHYLQHVPAMAKRVKDKFDPEVSFSQLYNDRKARFKIKKRLHFMADVKLDTEKYTQIQLRVVTTNNGITQVGSTTHTGSVMKNKVLKEGVKCITQFIHSLNKRTPPFIGNDYLTTKEVKIYEIEDKNNKTPQPLDFDRMGNSLCDEWRLNPTRNPVTKRAISVGGPIYKRLERECNTSPQVKSKSPASKDVCSIWRANPLINPETERKITEGGSVYKRLAKLCKAGATPQGRKTDTEELFIDVIKYIISNRIKVNLFIVFNDAAELDVHIDTLNKKGSTEWSYNFNMEHKSGLNATKEFWKPYKALYANHKVKEYQCTAEISLKYGQEESTMQVVTTSDNQTKVVDWAYTSIGREVLESNMKYRGLIQRVAKFVHVFNTTTAGLLPFEKDITELDVLYIVPDK